MASQWKRGECGFAALSVTYASPNGDSRRWGLAKAQSASLKRIRGVSFHENNCAASQIMEDPTRHNLVRRAAMERKAS